VGNSCLNHNPFTINSISNSSLPQLQTLQTYTNQEIESLPEQEDENEEYNSDEDVNHRRVGINAVGRYYDKYK